MQGIYDEQDRMLAYGNTVYQYNTQGSLTSKISGEASLHRDTTHYQYDLIGNLLAVSLPNGDQIEYLIDPQNRRVGKILNGIVIKKWIYQDQLNPIAELDGSGNLISRFVYGSKVHIPDYVVRNDTTYRVITDHLGSVRVVVNITNGEVVQEISYNEFGVVINNSNPGFQPFAYAGGLYDVQTRLVRFGVRDYDAGVGRWTAKDPIKFDAGFNLYAYCHNDPINYIDPTGMAEYINTSPDTVQTIAHPKTGFLNPEEIKAPPYRHDLTPGDTTPKGPDWDYYKRGNDWIKCSIDAIIDTSGNPHSKSKFWESVTGKNPYTETDSSKIRANEEILNGTYNWYGDTLNTITVP